MIYSRARERFGGERINQPTCPGEAACQTFKSQAGKDRADKERKVCIGGLPLPGGGKSIGCELYPTKARYEKTFEINDFLDNLETIWLESRTGYGKRLNELTPTEHEALIIWQDAIEKFTVAKADSLEKTILAALGVKAE